MMARVHLFNFFFLEILLLYILVSELVDGKFKRHFFFQTLVAVDDQQSETNSILLYRFGSLICLFDPESERDIPLGLN